MKPAYSSSFLLSINIFVWQNVLYFIDAPSIYVYLRIFRHVMCNKIVTIVKRKTYSNSVQNFDYGVAILAPTPSPQRNSDGMYVSINKLLINFQNCFGVLSRLCQAKRLKDDLSFRMSPGPTYHRAAGKMLRASYTGLSESVGVSGVTRLRVKHPRNRGSIHLFSRGSRSALGPTQLPTQCVPLFHPVKKIVERVKFNTDLHLVRMLRISEAIPLLPKTPSLRGQGQFYLYQENESTCKIFGTEIWPSLILAW